MGRVALRPPAIALGGAEPWGAVGEGVAGPGQATRPGAGQAWGVGRRLGCWAAMAAGAARCAKLEGQDGVAVRLTASAPRDPSPAFLLHHDLLPVSLQLVISLGPLLLLTNCRIRTVPEKSTGLGS